MSKNNDFYATEEDKEIPITANYLSFDIGDNTFRILGSFAKGTAKRGIQYFTEVGDKKKPVRLSQEASIPASELGLNKFGEPEQPIFFWAFPIWNYNARRIQIATITQKTILRVIKSYIENPKWGNPHNYDFIVTKTKTGDKTEYSTTVNPKEEIDPTILEQYKNTHIDMDAWFRSEDPFVKN